MDPITQGCDWTCKVTVTNQDIPRGELVDILQGASLSVSLRTRKGATAASATSAVVLDASQLLVQIGFSAAATAGLTAGRYLWDAEVTTSGGAVYALELESVLVREFSGAS